MGDELLRHLMIISSLGSEWNDASKVIDPSKIPVQEIVDAWREGSTRGRYEGAMWTAAGLEEALGA